MKSSIIAILCMIAASQVFAANPIVPGIGLADPHVVIYGNHAWMYATHDFSPASKGFVMKDWWVWSSADLVNWKQEGTLQPQDTFLKKPFDDCWATFGISKNGKYYWYFSAGRDEIGVVVADAPNGPWKDPLGKPLIPAGFTPTQQRDPDLMIDDDGNAYMVFGTYDYFIVRLNDDMVSLAEPPRPIVLDHKAGPYGEGKTDDKPSLHRRNGIYYLSWSSFYAMSTNVYGPYTYKGSVITPEGLAPEFRKGNIRHDRHGNFFTWHHQWYYACNDKSQPGCNGHFRDSVISYVHYRDNGEMVPIRLDTIGVGEYDAAQPRIEAEDYFNADSAEPGECPGGGFEVRSIRDGSWLDYPNVTNLPANSPIFFRVASGNPQGGIIEIRANGVKGELLGTCQVSNTGSSTTYKMVECKLKNAPGKKDICLVFHGGAGELLRLDWFSFQRPAK